MTTVTLKGDTNQITTGDNTDITGLWAFSAGVYSNNTAAAIVTMGGSLLEEGTGFTSFDAHGFATSGTLTKFTIVVPPNDERPAITATWSDFSIGAKGFAKIMKTADSDAYVNLFFGGDDTIHFNVGGATVRAGKGNDTFFGAQGDDLQYGGNGHDVLKGAAGEDLLVGGANADDLTGGADADTFQYALTSDSHKGDVDVIHDLSNNDFIDVSDIDADTNTSGTQSFVIADAFTGVAGQLTVTFDASHHRTVIAGDTDGNAKADLIIYASGAHEDYSNFILVPGP